MEEIGIHDQNSIKKFKELATGVPPQIYGQSSEEAVENGFAELIRSGPIECYHGTTTVRKKLKSKSPFCVTFDPFHALQIALQRTYVEDNIRKSKGESEEVKPLIYKVSVDLRKLSVRKGRRMEGLLDRKGWDASYLLAENESGKWYVEELKLLTRKAIKKSRRSQVLTPEESLEILRWRKRIKPFPSDVLLR
ncbi:hypothetical protein KKB40_00690 [Patescibacteria group bacterium]|nr:hypothetical protein [Patescibacteria group bacterium]